MILRLLVLFSMLTLHSAAQTIRVESSGELEFPVTVLDGQDKLVTASLRPQWRITFLGSPSGFSVSMQGSELRSSRGVLPAESLGYQALGGVILPLEESNFPLRETGLQGNLGRSLRVLTAPAGTQGRWDYLPNPGSFSLRVPASAYSGNFRGSLTMTLTVGP